MSENKPPLQHTTSNKNHNKGHALFLPLSSFTNPPNKPNIDSYLMHKHKFKHCPSFKPIHKETSKNKRSQQSTTNNKTHQKTYALLLPLSPSTYPTNQPAFNLSLESKFRYKLLPSFKPNRYELGENKLPLHTNNIVKKPHKIITVLLRLSASPSLPDQDNNHTIHDHTHQSMPHSNLKPVQCICGENNHIPHTIVGAAQKSAMAHCKICKIASTPQPV